MQMTSAQTEQIAPASKKLGESLGDAPWLAEARAKGAATADRLAMPDSRRERPWKYLDVSNLRPESFPVVADGEELTIEADQSRVTAAKFSELSGPAADAVAKHFGTAVSSGLNKLTALHYALLRDGVVVHVPADVELAEPIRLKRTYAASQFAAPHTLIVTGPNSRVTIVQEFHSGDDEIVATPVTEIIPGPGSEIRYYTLHRWGEKTQVFEHQRFFAEQRDAALQSLNVFASGQVVKSHIEASLIGRGTSSELLGVGYGTGHNHADVYTVQDHIGPDTRSDLLVKSTLRDNARAVYYGLTKVGLGAHNADANQENRNLLLSKTAKADSDPVLEILTNDVIRVSHGATAGPVDQEQLYYLQTRGIPYAAAEALLVRAFLGAVLGRIPNEGLRDEFAEIIDARLERI